MQTKKLPYGEKALRVRAVLEQRPDWSDGRIARKVGCAPSYVHYLRKLNLAPLELTPKMELDEPVQPEAEVKPEPKPEPPKVDELDGVLNNRASTYGSFAQSAHIAVQLKGVMHNAIARGDVPLFPDQLLALDMIAVKISRILSGNPSHRDSWVDIAGYAKLVADRLEGKVR